MFLRFCVTDNAPNMIKALRDINEIVETELDDQEELQDGDEEQLASDSPLLEMDTTEEEIEAVRRETEALKQQMDAIESIPPPEGMTRLSCVAHKVRLCNLLILIQFDITLNLGAPNRRGHCEESDAVIWTSNQEGPKVYQEV